MNRFKELWESTKETTVKVVEKVKTSESWAKVVKLKKRYADPFIKKHSYDDSKYDFKYTRNKNFLHITWLMLFEAVWIISFIGVILGFAKNYSSHLGPVIFISLMMAISHGLTCYVSVWGLQNIERHPSYLMNKSLQRAIYWNVMIGGLFLYPLFVVWYAYKNSGFERKQIEEFTKKYLYKHFNLVLAEEAVQERLTDEFKKEQENVEKLVQSNHLKDEEGHKYLFDYLFGRKTYLFDHLLEEAMIDWEILLKIEAQNLDKIIEDAN